MERTSRNGDLRYSRDVQGRYMYDNEGFDERNKYDDLKDTTEHTEQNGHGTSQTFKEFSAETTFHGLKFITDDSAFLSRRIAWVLVVVLALIGFFFLVTIKLLHYYRYESQIDLSTSFLNKITFPKVTLCNQNPHRLTALHKNGVYDAVASAYDRVARSPLQEQEFTGSCNDYYEARPYICTIPDNTKMIYDYYEISYSVCEHLCSNLKEVSSRCSGFIYDTTNRTCRLTSYTAGAFDNVEPRSDLGRCSGEVIYYRRRRCTELVSFRCHMEDICEYLVNDERDALDTFTEVGGKDNTLSTNSGNGQYMYLLESPVRPGYDAKLKTPYLKTDDKCLLLHYRFFGDNQTTLRVVAIQENLHEVELINLNRTADPEDAFFYDDGFDVDTTKWRPLLVPLKPGIHQIMIHGIRGQDGASGLGIDDVEINFCTAFERECKTNFYGQSYLGTKAETIHGEPCINWEDVKLEENGTLLYDTDTALFNADPDDLNHNYCRNIDGGPYGVFCFTEHLIPNPCDIPYCGCPDGWFRCTDGACIPSEWKCDGKDDCNDRADEKNAQCEIQKSFECDFSGLYKCGYERLVTGSGLNFERIEQNRDIGNGKTHDLVLQIPDEFDPGSTTLIRSPTHNFSKNTIVTFDATFEVEGYDTISSLKAMLTDERNYHVSVLWQANSKENSGPWNTREICMPSGSHSIVWLATIGVHSQAKIGIGQIKLTERSCDYTPPDTDRNSVECDFDLDICGHVERSSNYHFRWERIPVSSISTAINAINNLGYFGGCGGTFYDAAGVLASPNFPFEYNEDQKCSETIEQPTGAKISYSFLSFHLEEATDCFYDYLKITDGATKYGPFCGNETTPEARTSTSNILKTEFVSDYSISESGYHLKYTSAPVAGIDYAMAASVRSDQVYGEPNPVVSSLYSPLQTFTELSCLSFEAIILSGFKVYLSSDVTSTIPKHLILDVKNKFNLGSDWSLVTIDVAPFESTGDRSVVYQSIFTDYNPMYTAVINNVQLRPGPCASLYKSGNINCDFEEKTACSYIDVSASTVHWLRGTIKGESRTNNLMVAQFGKNYNSASLLSPIVTVSSGQCLKFDVTSTKSTLLFVDQTNEAGDSSTPLTYHRLVEGMKTEVVALSSGTYRLVIRAFSSQNVVLLDDIRLTAGPCIETGNDASTYNGPGLIPEEEPSDTSDPVIQIPSVVTENINRNEEVKQTKNQTYTLWTDNQKNTNSSDFFNKTAHHKDGFLLKCDFKGKPCKEKYLKEELTDMGMCITFNSDPLDPLELDLTGSLYGLKLLLNLEEYEQVAGLAIDTGVSMMITQQDDEMLMRTLSATVPPGAHTLVGLQYRKESFLEPQYGKCGVKELERYPLGTNYTHNRCVLDCTTKVLEERCGCKEPHMPGPKRVCSVEEHLNCVLPERYSGTPAHCDCLIACESYKYPYQLSYTSLSSRAGNTLLSKNLDMVVRDKYDALNIRERVTQDRIFKTLQKLYEITNQISLLSDDVNFFLLDSSTSVVGRTELAMDKIKQMYERDTLDLYGKLGTMKTEYKKLVQPSYDAAIDLLTQFSTDVVTLAKIGRYVYGYAIFEPEELDEISVDVVQHKLEESKTDLEALYTMMVQLKKTIGLVELAAEESDYIFISLSLEAEVYEKVNENQTLPVRTVSSRLLESKCQETTKELNKDMIEIEELFKALETGLKGTVDDSSTPNPTEQTTQFPDSSGDGYDNNWANNWSNETRTILESFDRLSNKTNSLTEHKETLITCMTQYSEFLVALENTLRSTRFNSFKISNTLSGSVSTATVDKINKQYVEWMQEYSKNEISKLELVNRINEQQVKHLKDALSGLQRAITNHILQPIDTEIMKLESDLITAYESSFNEMVMYTKYFTKDETMQQTAKSANIWRRPYPEINKATVLEYEKTKKQGERSVPDNFEVYIQNNGRQVIRTNLNNYFVNLLQIFGFMDKQISNTIGEIEDQVSMLMHELAQYKEESGINGNFIEDNLILLDIYFGTLVYEEVEQKKEYDLTSFFSDFGGYMGLLLGGSVVSIVEIIDWCIFSMLLKNEDKKRQLHKANERRPVDDGMRHSRGDPRGNDARYSRYYTDYSSNPETGTINIREWPVHPAGFYPDPGEQDHPNHQLPQFSGQRRFYPKPGEGSLSYRGSDAANEFYHM